MAKRNTKTSFFKPKVPKRVTSLNWEQSKKRFPLINPYGDIDRDGVKNFQDCRPFDIKRQDENDKKKIFEDIAIGFGTIKRLKTIGEVQKLEEDILKKDKENDEKER